jgi:4-hydroxy-2-oxoheptanedioate aldolase
MHEDDLIPAGTNRSEGCVSRGRDFGTDGFAGLLRREAWLVGTVLSSPDPVLAERVAQSFDFVWIDLEHSALSVGDAQVLAIAVKAGGASALVRLPRSDSELLAAILDAGVDGIVAPKVSTSAQAAALVCATRYPPAGSRGFAPRRASRGRASVDVTIGDAAKVACIVQIETREALENLDAIAATDGVDGLVVGTADLSMDLGLPLQLATTALESAVNAAGEAARRQHKPWGVAAGARPEWVTGLRAAGASMLVFSSDARLYSEAVEQCALRLRATAAEAPA